MPRKVSAVCNSKIETVRALAARERNGVFVTAVKLQNFVLVAALEMLLGIVRDPQIMRDNFRRERHASVFHLFGKAHASAEPTIVDDVSQERFFHRPFFVVMAFLDDVQVGIDERTVAKNRVIAAFREELFHLVELARQPYIVLVGQVNQVARSLAHGVFKIVRHTVVFVVENLDARIIIALDDFQRIVFRSVVRNDELVIFPKLRNNAVQLFLDVFGAIVGRHANASSHT